MFVIQSRAKNLENINYMHTRFFVATLLWMTDGYIKKGRREKVRKLTTAEWGTI